MQTAYSVIDLARIRGNARKIIERAKKPLIAVVKDDAYGHGAPQVAAALHGIADCFAVATAEEGAMLRIAGTEEEIVVLTPPVDVRDALVSAAYSLTPTLSSRRTFAILARAHVKKVHLAVNTGMNRYGVRPDRLFRLLSDIAEEGMEVGGVFSHLYAAEEEEARTAQKSLFSEASAAVKEKFPEVCRHLSATGGMLAGDDFDAVRVGLALYGYLPAGTKKGIAVRPAMRVYAPVAERRVPFGDGAGYCRAPQKYPSLNTLAVGYGQGFFRKGGFGIGALCMDACVAEGALPAGRRKLLIADMEEYAAARGTTVYETLVRIGKGTPRLYRP